MLEHQEFVKTSFHEVKQASSGLLAKSYRQCPSEAKTYALCVHKNVTRLKQDLCSKEIQSLMECIKRAL